MQSTDAGAKTEENVEEKTEEYSATMQQAMGTCKLHHPLILHAVINLMLIGSRVQFTHF